jgi:hypothetical protein
VIEIGADLFRRLGAVHPAAIEKIGLAALQRRAGLEAVRSAAAGATTAGTASLTSMIKMMKRFLRLA